MVPQDNIEMLNDTLSILQQGYYQINGRRVSLKLSRTEMEEISVYLPQDIEQLKADTSFRHIHAIDRAGVGCENADSYTLARKRTEDADFLLGKDHLPVLVLNLANPVNPGGGVRRGTKAQEEDLCRKSSLLLSLESDAAKAYYSYNKSLQTYMGSDAIMITPKVEIIKDENGELLPESVIVSVMTCAAPKVSDGKEGMTEQEYEDMVYQRITGMLKCAAHLGYQMIILGAFGCGAFENDAHVVSDLFYKAMKEFDYDGMKLEDCFRRFDFAVLNRSGNSCNFKEFSRNFSNFYREEDEKEVADALNA